MDFDLERVTVALWVSKKDNARSLGIEFKLSTASIKNILRAKKCYYAGLPLDWRGITGSKITIDRVDATKGYVKGNVVACSTEANSLKSVIESQHGKNQQKLLKSYEETIKMLQKTVKRIKGV